jgi:hypothetical protein
MIPIVNGRSQLVWAHYRSLLRISDGAQRKSLTLQADREGWTAEVLDERVTALNASLPAGNANAAGGNSPAVDLLTPQRGTPGVHRVARVGGNLVVDLGFATYLDLTEEQAAAVREGDLVSLDGNGRPALADGATKADLFNYRVELLKVVDGDTLWVKIYLRPRQWVKQKLRLRGLDCPELSTPEGKTAKRFVDALLAKTTAITISTTKPDKYDRYLADVFLEPQPGSISHLSTLNSQPREALLYLNNELLTHGQAVRKDAWEFGD